MEDDAHPLFRGQGEMCQAEMCQAEMCQAGSVHGRPSRPSLEPRESSDRSPRSVGQWSPKDDGEQRAQCLTQGGCPKLLHSGVGRDGVGNRDQSRTGGGPEPCLPSRLLLKRTRVGSGGER